MVPLLVGDADRRDARLEARRSRRRARPAQGGARDRRPSRCWRSSSRGAAAASLAAGAMALAVWVVAGSLCRAGRRGCSCSGCRSARSWQRARGLPRSSLRHDARARRRRRAGRRRHRVERLAERGDPGDAAGRDAPSSRATSSRSTGIDDQRGAELRRAGARPSRSRRDGAPVATLTPGEALLPGRAPADLRGRHRHRAAGATSTSCWAIRPKARRRGAPHRAHLPQSAGDVDLGRRARSWAWPGCSR